MCLAMFNVFINNKDPITTIKVWKNKAVMMRIALPDIRVYYKASVIKTTPYQCINRYTGQWNRKLLLKKIQAHLET